MSAIDNLKSGLTSWVKMPVQPTGDGALKSYLNLADVLGQSMVSYKYGSVPAGGYPMEAGDPGQLFIASDGSGCFVWIPSANAWAPIVGGATGGGGPDLPGEFEPPWGGTIGVPQEIYNLIDAAQAAADAAKAAADEAKITADAANAEIANIANESKLHPARKVPILFDYRSILYEKERILQEARIYAISTTDYLLAVTALDDLMRSIGLVIGLNEREWLSTTTNTDVQTIVNAIDTARKEREKVLYAFVAQTTILLNKFGASEAAEQAVIAMGDDNVLTPAEKYSVLNSFRGFYSAQVNTNAKAVAVGVDPGLYNDAIDELKAYMASLGLPITARSNILQRSSEFLNVPWTKTSRVVLTTGETDPLGATGAIKLRVEPPESEGEKQYLKQTVNVNPSVTHTFSFYVNAAEINGIGESPSAPMFSVYDETNAAYLVIPTAYITKVNEWERVSVSAFIPPDCTTATFAIVDGADDCAITIWGAQVEEGDSATPLIQTADFAVSLNDTERDSSYWLSQNSTIDGQRFRRLFEEASVQTSAILAALSEHAKNAADTAQEAAEFAQTTAEGRVLPNFSNVIDGAVKEAMLDDGVVSTIKLADNAVNASKIIAGSISQSKLNADVASTTFRQTWEAWNQNDWQKFQGDWTDLSIQNTGGSTGGKVLRATERVWIYWNQNIPFDPSRLYKLRTRFRQLQSPTSPPKGVFAGLTGVAEDGTTLVNVTGGALASSQHYGPSNYSLTTWDGVSADKGWVEFTYYWKGHGASSGSGGNANPRTPGALHPNVRYIRPLIIFNYDLGDAIQECDLIELTVSADAAELGGQLVGAQIADQAIDMVKFASGIRPPRVVSSLPVVFTGYALGDTVVLTTDQKLYRFTGSGFTAAIPTADLSGNISAGQIANNAIDMTKLANDIRPPRVVAALPESPFTGYALGDTVVLTTDQKLYRFTGSGFTTAILTSDLSGQITGGQIANGTITAEKVAFSTGGANKAPNSNFEFDSNADGWADSWAAYTGVQGGTGIVDVGGYDNGKCQSFRADGTTLSPRMYMTASRPFVRNGTHLVVSAYMKAVAGTQLIIGVKGFSTESGAGTENSYTIAPAVTATGSWQRVIVNHTMTVDEYISMFPGMTGTPAAGTQLWVDCVQIEEGDVATAYAPKPGEIMPGVVTASMLADNAVSLAKFAAGLRPVRAVAVLPSSPYTDYVAGDTVVRTTDNKLFRFTGSGFTAEIPAADLSGSIGSGLIGDNAITTAKLADGTVSASKLLGTRSAGSALNSNPECNDITAYTGYAEAGATLSVVAITDGKVGSNALRATFPGYHVRDSKRFAVDSSKTYRLRMYARKSASADGAFYPRIYWFKGDGTASTTPFSSIANPPITTTFQPYEGNVTAPADAVEAHAGPVLNYLGTAGYHEIQDLRVEEVLPGTLILDGAVAAGKLADGAVTAVKFATGLGGGNLIRNSSFEVDSFSDGLADGWVIYNNGGDATTATIQPSGGMYGGKFQRITWAGVSTSTKGVHTNNGYTVGSKSCGVLGGWRDNTWYTISWYAKASAGVQGRGMYLGWNNGPQTSTAITNPNLTDSWQRYAYRVKWNAGAALPGGSSLWISISGTGATGDLDIDAVQVEEGEVPTAYAPMTDEILPSSITSTEIGANAVGSTQLADNAVATTAKIAAGVVTAAKLKVKKHYIF